MYTYPAQNSILLDYVYTSGQRNACGASVGKVQQTDGQSEPYDEAMCLVGVTINHVKYHRILIYISNINPRELVWRFFSFLSLPLQISAPALLNPDVGL